MAIPPRAPNNPRITANDLALFMVSSDTARLGIIRRAKSPQTPPIIRYKDVRPVVGAFLADDNRRVGPLSVAEAMFQHRAEDAAESALRQDDARNCIAVIRGVQNMANQLAPFTFRAAPTTQPKLNLSGVDVSVRADLLATMPIRALEHAGAAMFRLTQDDADTETARGRRREMGLYVATLIRLHVDANLFPALPVSNRLCMSIDVQHGELFQAPDSNTRRTNDLVSACQMIAALWPSI